MATSGLDIRIHLDFLEEVNALIEAGDIGDYLERKIEGIRDVLRNALDSNSASFLPHTADQDERNQNRKIRFQSTANLLAASTACDALCIDDRFFNSHPLQAESPGQSVPIVCVLDVLRYLVSRGCIGDTDEWTARHRLRQGGFVFVPIGSDELVHRLKTARVRNDQLTETAELRVLRQTMARIDSLELADQREAGALAISVFHACTGAIQSIWGDISLTIEQATVLSDWIWIHLLSLPHLDHQHSTGENYTNSIRNLISIHSMRLLLQPTITEQPDRRDHYARWIEQSVLGPMRPANMDTVAKTLTFARESISTLEDHQEAFGNRFLQQLPEFARAAVITEDPEFARRCGFETQRIFQIGTDIKLQSSELFGAASEVFATMKEKTVQDIHGKKVSVSLDREGQNILVEWSDPESIPQQASFPPLSLLSSDRKTRITTLRSLIEQFGPTAPDFQGLLKNMETRAANYDDLSVICNQLANGVAVVQASVIEKINSGSFSAVDVIPRSISYFERFAGPAPDAREAEAYFREVLIPHRKALLSRDVRVGLDICCLGALRDDLTPGQWVTDVDDDVVWDAIASCDAQSNPFSLLGALDVALYRQGHDHRFREFSVEAVATLLDGRSGEKDRKGKYRLLQVCADFALNSINILDNGPTRPSYWKRMCSWMQAGLISRTLTGLTFAIDVDTFQEWTRENMGAAGVYAGLIDARKEPMLFAGRITPQTLENEVLRRLYILKSRHGGEGRQLPRSEDIERQLELPGPLEGHRRPIVPIPREVTDELKDARADSSDPVVLQPIVTVSQIFRLGETELEYVLKAVKQTAENNPPCEPNKGLERLELCSVVAVANRHTMLADGVADAVIKLAPNISEVRNVQRILQIMLQAAAAYEAHDAWSKWLEERLANIAINLPPPPNQCLRMFLTHLDGLGMVLPLKSWFYVRARSIRIFGC